MGVCLCVLVKTGRTSGGGEKVRVRFVDLGEVKRALPVGVSGQGSVVVVLGPDWGWRSVERQSCGCVWICRVAVAMLQG